MRAQCKPALEASQDWAHMYQVLAKDVGTDGNPSVRRQHSITLEVHCCAAAHACGPLRMQAPEDVHVHD